MNLRMFPVQPNSSRRLRRGNSASVSEPLSRHSSYQEFSCETVSQGVSSELLYLSPSDQEMLIRQQAMDKIQQGQLTEAIELFTVLICYNPHNASNFNNRGLLYFQNGSLEKALTDYNRALGLNPRLGKVYNNRANCYATLGLLELAIADYETALDLDPLDIRARLNQGITFRQLDQYEDAIASHDLALQFAQLLASTDETTVPASVEGHLYAERGRAYHLLGDWNCAIADYYRALDRLPLAESSQTLVYRLRSQVKGWLDELLAPLKSEN